MHRPLPRESGLPMRPALRQPLPHCPAPALCTKRRGRSTFHQALTRNGLRWPRPSQASSPPFGCCLLLPPSVFVIRSVASGNQHVDGAGLRTGPWRLLTGPREVTARSRRPWPRRLPTEVGEGGVPLVLPPLAAETRVSGFAGVRLAGRQAAVAAGSGTLEASAGRAEEPGGSVLREEAERSVREAPRSTTRAHGQAVRLSWRCP